MVFRRLSYSFLYLALYLSIEAGCTFNKNSKDHIPSADLEPGQVLIIQLEALKQNQAPANDGLKLAYLFTTPDFKEKRETVEEFKSWLEEQGCEPLINAKEFELAEHYIDYAEAQYFVSVLDQSDIRSNYIFDLTRVNSEPFVNYWLLEGIYKVKDRIENPHRNPDQRRI